MLSYSLDPDLSLWDVSEVTGMFELFKNQANFTGKGLEKWDVSKVTEMGKMFNLCTNFTGKCLERWNVVNVTDTSGMFRDCKNFNANLENWKLNGLADISDMFKNCTSFTGKGLEKWNVANMRGKWKWESGTATRTGPIDNLSGMFSGCSKFNGDLRNWDVSNISIMDDMFKDCNLFLGRGLENWKSKFQQLKSITGMFENCTHLCTENVQDWDVTGVYKMTRCFANCTQLTNLNWTTEAVDKMDGMFSDCSKLVNVHFTHVTKVKNTENMFKNCTNFIGAGLESWNVSQLQHMAGMFINCTNLAVDLSHWQLSSVVLDQALIFPPTFSLERMPRMIQEQIQRVERERQAALARERELTELMQGNFRREREIHTAMDSMDYDEFKLVVSETPGFDLPKTQIEDICNYIENFFKTNIENLFNETEQNELLNQVNTILEDIECGEKEKNYLDVNKTNFWEKTVLALHYVSLQKPLFITFYIKHYITSVFTAYEKDAHHPDGRSCPKGMWERFTFAIKLTIEDIQLFSQDKSFLPENWQDILKTFEQVQPAVVFQKWCKKFEGREGSLLWNNLTPDKRKMSLKISMSENNITPLQLENFFEEATRHTPKYWVNFFGQTIKEYELDDGIVIGGKLRRKTLKRNAKVKTRRAKKIRCTRKRKQTKKTRRRR